MRCSKEWVARAVAVGSDYAPRTVIDVEVEARGDERPPANDATGDDTEDEGTVYIGESGQVYDHPYLPASAARELGWR